MTVPIIPGPFSFLGEAGAAAGKIGQALLERKQKYRQDFMDSLALVGQGADVPMLPFLDLAQKAGVPIDASGAAQLFDMAKRRARAQLTTAEADARGSGYRADILGANAGIAPEMAMAGLTTALAGGRRATAEAATAEEAARAAPSAADAQISQSKMQQSIFNDALDMLGDAKNDAFKKIATYAAVGGMPYLVQQIESNRLYSTELRNDARLLAQVMAQVQQTYQQAEKDWMQNVSNEAFKQNINLQGAEGEAFIQEYSKQFPRPDRAMIRADVLQQFGMDDNSFKAAAARTFPRIFGPAGGGQGANTQPGGAPLAPGSGTQAPPATDPIDQAAQLLISGPTRANAKLFVDAFKAGQITRMQARAVIARARKGGVPDSLLRLIEIEIPGSK